MFSSLIFLTSFMQKKAILTTQGYEHDPLLVSTRVAEPVVHCHQSNDPCYSSSPQTHRLVLVVAVAIAGVGKLCVGAEADMVG